MQMRVFLLFGLLFLRIIIGLSIVYYQSEIERISVAGNIIKVIRNSDKCIIYSRGFIAESDLFCKMKKGETVYLIGSPRFRLIEAIKGKIVLDDAILSKNVVFKNSSKYPNQILVLVERVRNYSRNIYQSFMLKDESALLAGIVLGDKENIGYDFYQKMVSSGSIHIAVASGFNLMLVGGASMSLLFWFLERKRATFVVVGVLVFYAVLAGFGAPVFRALIMSFLIFISQAFGRKVDAWWSLFLSAWFMIIWDFGLLWDISFQLSVTASLAMMVLAPKFIEWASLHGFETEAAFLEKMSVVSTVTVMLLTTPIIWYHFGRVNLIGLFSNIFILPLVPPVMILGSLMLVLPQVFFVPTYALVHLIVRLIYFFGG